MEFLFFIAQGEQKLFEKLFQLFLNDPVVTGILGAIVGILFKNWIDYIKKIRLEEERNLIRARLEYIRRQLSEFYWPLEAALIKDEAIWRLRKNIEELEDEQEREKARETIERELLLPNHEKMVQIIQGKLHLAGYASPPEAYKKYLEHVAAFQTLRLSGIKLPPSQVGAPWPADFEKEVHEKTNELSKEYARLLKLSLYGEEEEK